jgi:hypothetical protein
MAARAVVVGPGLSSTNLGFTRGWISNARKSAEADLR